MAAALRSGDVFVFDVATLGQETFDACLRDLFTNDKVLKVFHDARCGLHALRQLFRLYSAVEPIWDTQLADVVSRRTNQQQSDTLCNLADVLIQCGVQHPAADVIRNSNAKNAGKSNASLGAMILPALFEAQVLLPLRAAQLVKPHGRLSVSLFDQAEIKAQMESFSLRNALGAMRDNARIKDVQYLDEALSRDIDHVTAWWRVGLELLGPSIFG